MFPRGLIKQFNLFSGQLSQIHSVSTSHNEVFCFERQKNYVSIQKKNEIKG